MQMFIDGEILALAPRSGSYATQEILPPTTAAGNGLQAQGPILSLTSE